METHPKIHIFLEDFTMKVTRLLATAAVAAMASAAVAATASAYDAAISFQNTVYSFREGMANANYGASSAYWADKVIMWGGNSEETWPDLIDNFDWDISGYVFDANYTDASFEGDGTYTVTADGFDWAQDKCDAFNFIQISTDIPFASFDPAGTPTAFVTSATVYVDGVAQATVEPPVEGDANGNLVINCVNIYNSECPAYTGAYPTDSLSVEFTIEGLGGGDAAADEPADTGAVDTGAATTDNKGGSPDTGVEGVAAVAGLAVVAGGAMLLSKKRK